MELRTRFGRGFTLIELLVVITIIAVLASLIFAMSGTMKTKADETHALSNLRQVGVGLLTYTADHSYTLPGRVRSPDQDRWPALLAPYCGDTRVYAAPGLPNFITEKQDPISNAQNHTSFIINGFNDQGAFDDAAVQIRTNNFEQLSEVILLGMQIDTSNFYMDFLEKNQDGVLKLDAYNQGSVYLFADGAARFITKVEYETPRPGTAVRQGDWLWLANKSAAIPQ